MSGEKEIGNTHRGALVRHSSLRFSGLSGSLDKSFSQLSSQIRFARNHEGKTRAFDLFYGGGVPAV